MPLRIQDDFSGGMNSDVATKNTVRELFDLYPGRYGNLITRGPVANVSIDVTTPSGYWTAAVADAAFHDGLQAGALIRMAGSTAAKTILDAEYAQLIGFPAAAINSDDAPTLTLGYATKGTNANEVHLDHSAAVETFPVCYQHAETSNEIVFAGRNSGLFKWGGSILAEYTTGTVAVTAGSRTVTGTGTSWLANVAAGQYILIDGVGEKAGNGEQRAFRITQVVSNTSLIVDYAMAATVSGKSYRTVCVAAVQSPPSVHVNSDDRPTSRGVVAYHQGRLFIAHPYDQDASAFLPSPDRIRWSANAADVGDGGSEAGFHHIDLWRSTGSLEVGPGIGGYITGLVSFGDELIVLKQHAVFRVVGAVGFSGTTTNLNVQVQMIARGIGADSLSAFAVTQRGVVFAHQTGVYLYDGQEVKSLLDGRMSAYWEADFWNQYLHTVVAYHDKVLISLYFPHDPTNYRPNIVWDPIADRFWVMTGPRIGAGCTTLEATTLSDPAHLVFAQNNYTSGSGKLDLNYITNVCKGVYPGYEPDADRWVSTSGGPRPYVLTHPLPLGDGPQEGRVNNVIVESYQEEACEVYVIPSVLLETYHETEIGLLTSWASGGDDNLQNQPRVNRVPVDGMPLSPSASIDISSPLGGAELPAMLISKIGVEYTASDVRGPTA